MMSKQLFIEAAQACIGVFEDLDESEIKDFPPSIKSAWKGGRDLKSLLHGEAVQLNKGDNNDN